MHDTVRRVLSLMPRDSFSLLEILRLCHTCKGMRALITQNHGPILVDVSLDVEQMSSVGGLSMCRFDTEELTYDVHIATTREMLDRLGKFNMSYHVKTLSLDFCHEGYQANLTSNQILGGDCQEKLLFSALQNMRHLQRVNVYNVNLSTALVVGYLSTFTGTEVALVQCGLRMGGDFFNALGRLQTLVLLSLSGNSCLECSGPVNVFGTNLQVLNFSDCVSADVTVLCRGLPTALLELYWNDNHIPEEHTQQLFDWLPSCRTLTSLGLRNTSLCSPDVRALVATVARMPALASLDVASNEFQDDVLALADVMPRLRQFYVSARRCHHAALGSVWCSTRTSGRDDKFCMYEELEREDLDVDVDA
jgi:hypothetical protein